MTEIYTDTMVFSHDHALVMGHSRPNMDLDRIEPSLGEYGLFTTPQRLKEIYPESFTEGDEDLHAPESEDFIEPVFRLLSSTVVAARTMPTDFTTGNVLKDSMSMLKGQTVYRDHMSNVENHVGVVKSVYWQNSYTDKSTGMIIPAGINGVFKIDAKANPKVARGLLMEPPALHSNSVTVRFEWRPSHKFENPYEFWEKMGTRDDKGELIRRIVTKILSYYETSLVANGADPFAKKVGENGKLQRLPNETPPATKIRLDDDTKNEIEPDSNVSFIDLTQFSEPAQVSNNNQIINQNPKKMEESQLLSLFGVGLLTLGEGETATPELAISKLKSVVEKATTAQALSTELTATKAKLGELETQVTSLTKMAEVGNNYVKEVREQTVAAYRKLYDEKTQDANIIVVLENTETSLQSLQSFKKSYEIQLDKDMPLKCGKCGSIEVSRAASLKEVTTTDTTKNSDTSSVAKKIAKSKL
jgi:hypothetical protein